MSRIDRLTTAISKKRGNAPVDRVWVVDTSRNSREGVLSGSEFVLRCRTGDMDGKTGRPIISLKFKKPAVPEVAEAVEPRPAATQKPAGVAAAKPFAMPKPARKQALREVVVAKPEPKPEKPVEESKSAPPIEPAAFKAATKAAMKAAAAVVADPSWQSAELQRSYQEAKTHAQPVHRKQAKLISGIVMRRVAPDLPEESETRTLAMRAAYAAAFASLIESAEVLATQP